MGGRCTAHTMLVISWRRACTQRHGTLEPDTMRGSKLLFQTVMHYLRTKTHCHESVNIPTTAHPANNSHSRLC
jgi:hypothetical protein